MDVFAGHRLLKARGYIGSWRVSDSEGVQLRLSFHSASQCLVWFSRDTGFLFYVCLSCSQCVVMVGFVVQ